MHAERVKQIPVNPNIQVNSVLPGRNHCFSKVAAQAMAFQNSERCPCQVVGTVSDWQYENCGSDCQNDPVHSQPPLMFATEKPNAEPTGHRRNSVGTQRIGMVLRHGLRQCSHVTRSFTRMSADASSIAQKTVP